MFDKMFKSISRTLGEDAVYTPTSGDPVSCSVLIDFESELRPESLDIEIIEIGTTIEALVSDVGSPKRGSTFVIDSTTYTVKRTESNDRTFVKVVVNAD